MCIIYLRPTETAIYHSTTGVLKPITVKEICNLIVANIAQFPYSDMIWYPMFISHSNRYFYNISKILFHYIPAYAVDFLSLMTGNRPFLVSNHFENILINIRMYAWCMYNIIVQLHSTFLSIKVKRYHMAHAAISSLDFFWTNSWRFKSDNWREIYAKMTPKDKSIFDIDVSTINWKYYFATFCSGIRKFIQKEDQKSLPEARKRFRR